MFSYGDPIFSDGNPILSFLFGILYFPLGILYFLGESCIFKKIGLCMDLCFRIVFIFDQNLISYRNRFLCESLIFP